MIKGGCLMGEKKSVHRANLLILEDMELKEEKVSLANGRKSGDTNVRIVERYLAKP
jgi:hypothetical protein